MGIANRLLGLLVLGLLLAGCSAGEDRFRDLTESEAARLRAIVDVVDWDKAEAVEITLNEFSFSPEDLVFSLNRPYRLKLTNTGRVPHTFDAPGFFDAIAARGLIYDDGEASTPLLSAVALAPGESKTLVFVPARKGEYGFRCGQLFHAVLGMDGTVRVE